MKMENIVSIAITSSLLLLIIYISVYVRLWTLSSPTVLDYDPWWFYRHAKEILDNNYQALNWDILSHFPPGRPPEKFQGWAYTMAIFYKIAKFFSDISFVEVAKWSSVIMAGLAVIPAFFLGKLMSNKWGGLATAVFATLSPTLIGVSMGGYCDTDIVVVFYFLLSIFSVFLALSKRSIVYCAFAILTNLAFVYTWGRGWIPLLFFAAFIPVFIIFRLMEDLLHQKRLKFNLADVVKESKPIFIPLLIILIVTNIIGSFLNLSNVFYTIIAGVIFVRGQSLLVNISVAELQPLSILTKEGFLAVASRIGFTPVLFTLVGLPLLVLYKIYKKERIRPVEIFLFLWSTVTFYLIFSGVRFSLLVSTATAVSAGYVIGNLVDRLKKGIVVATVFGFMVILILMFLSDAIQIGFASAGMQISQNWYDALEWLKQNADKKSLIATWWDPGHIIAGYTGLKVHADGAQCGDCVPYNHNVRIQDMGRIFSTNSEDEAINILEKYRKMSPEKIEEVKKDVEEYLRTGAIPAYTLIPAEAFEPVSEIYLIASSDLIGKYYWMSFFGDCLKKFGLQSADVCYTNIEWFKNNAQGRNFIQLPFSSQDAQGNLNYGGIITLTMKDGRLVPIINVPQQGIRNAIIKELVFYQNGQEQRLSYGNVTNMVDGMLWVDSSFRVVIFMDSEVRDSVFTRLFFFNGEGLEHFELKYSNPELKIYKVIF